MRKTNLEAQQLKELIRSYLKKAKLKSRKIFKKHFYSFNGVNIFWLLFENFYTSEPRG
jgi:hypothetical protein